MENVDNFAKLVELKEEFLKACELYKQAVEEKKPQAEILRLEKRVILLYNEIQRILSLEPKVIQFESSQIPKEIRERYAGY